MRRFACGLAAALALAAAPASAATPDYAFDKPGATPDQVVQDMTTCATRASKIPTVASPVVATSLVGGLIAGVAVGVVEGVQRGRQVSAAADTCMLGLGYSRLTLTPEESRAMRSARGPEAKKAWIRAFVATDQSARIAEAAAATPKTTPQLQPEPFAIAGVRLDPSTLKMTPGVIRQGKPILTVTAAHRATAVLNGEVQASTGLVHVTMKGGETLYAVDPGGMPSVAQSTLWCGPSTAHAFGSDHAAAACLFSTQDGDQMLPAAGGEWMMSLQNVPAAVKPLKLTGGKVDLTLAADDRIGPMELTLEPYYIDDADVRLRAVVQRDGKRVTLWTGTIEFDGTRRATLPFWTKRLVMTRGDGVHQDPFTLTAVLTDDGAGGDWVTPDPVEATRTTAAAAHGGGA